MTSTDNHQFVQANSKHGNYCWRLLRACVAVTNSNVATMSMLVKNVLSDSSHLSGVTARKAQSGAQPVVKMCHLCKCF